MAAPLKVLTWNVQFMAGKNYCFFWDRSDGGGKDWRVRPADTAHTLDEVARVLRDENADIVLLQEVDVGSRRVNYQDQEAELVGRVGDIYPHRASCYYWHAPFVPHPKIMGPVGMKLLTLSRHPMVLAQDVPLPKIPRNWFVDLFHIKRRVLEVRVRLPDGRQLTAFNTHLEAFPDGDDVVLRQVRGLLALWQGRADEAWVAGGDFNLIPPGAYGALNEIQRELYRPESEMALIYKAHSVVPTLEQVTGPGAKDWATFNSNDKRIGYPDRTLDYLVHSAQLTVALARVRRGDTLKISDHLPLVAQLRA